MFVPHRDACVRACLVTDWGSSPECAGALPWGRSMLSTMRDVNLNVCTLVQMATVVLGRILPIYAQGMSPFMELLDAFNRLLRRITNHKGHQGL